MKVAVPTRGNVVDDHFGHCEMYTVFTIDQNKGIAHKEIVPSPQGCGCKSNIAAVLREKGVGLLLAGNMGAGALNVLNRHDIEVVRGCQGDVEQLVSTFLKGEIADSGVGCDHHHDHDGEHVCNH
jgi:predicted Fe-Mo cluster-binding NifX family protein